MTTGNFEAVQIGFWSIRAVLTPGSVVLLKQREVVRHPQILNKGRGLVARRYLVIVFPFDLLTNQLAESPVTFVISSQVHRNFNSSRRFVDVLDLKD